jgi:hypothetical protein
MNPSMWIILAVIALAVLAFRAFARSHQAWLERQTPLGAWTASTPDGAVTLVFEGGPHEGPYKQVIERDGQRIREFGHWAQQQRRLQLLIMASDVPNNPRLGIDTTYEVRFVAPDRITIAGPDRPGIEYSRAPAGTVLDFDEPAAG